MVRAQAYELLGKIRDHYRDHNITAPVSGMLPDTLDPLSRHAQHAHDLHMQGLQVDMTICQSNPLFKSGDTSKVIEYVPPGSPLDSHIDVMQVCGRLWNSAMSNNPFVID